MKKIIAAATGLMMVGGVMATTASAVESEFGGFWRTRMITEIDMDGQDSGSRSYVDTRTHLYYTAIFNENFKFVNKFEFDGYWGASNGARNSTGGNNTSYTKLGADGANIEIKNSYADFKLGNAQFKVGVQNASLARGFLFASDFAGVVAIFNAGDTVLPFAWVKVQDDVDTAVAFERDYYAVFPIIKVSDSLTLNPYFIYDKGEGIDHNNFYAGMDINMKMDAFSFWGTGIYEFGEVNGGQDVSAFLVAAGGSSGPVHGQAFYASGDDAFVNPRGASYYWSEIMGGGMIDNTFSNGSPRDAISNIWAANVGFKVKPADKLTVGADLWYAALVEDDPVSGESDLGFEVDVVVTYALMDNLKLDLIGAYLFAGDATGDEDPIEVGARLSLSF